MTHRERFHEAASHGHPDRAVYDLGCPQTWVDYETTKKDLADLLHLEGPKKGNYNLDERILEALDIDTRLVGDIATPPTSHCRQEGNIRYNSWGIGWADLNGRMEFAYSPLRDCTIDEMMAYEFPDPEKIDRNLIHAWANQARELHEKTDYAVVASYPVDGGIFEMGCWLFGYDDFLYRLAGEPEFVHAYAQRMIEYQKKVIDIYYGALGKYIDCTITQDDYGTQTGPFMSNAMFDEFFKPYLKERIDHTRKYTDAFIKHHSCGSVYYCIPSLIECGVDLLNPIQPGAYMMEPERLKKDFGDRVGFWGGIDTQHLLVHGSEQDVKNGVKKVLSVLDQNGGYVLAPAHTIQHDVPAQNVIAIYRGADEYYGRRKE